MALYVTFRVCLDTYPVVLTLIYRTDQVIFGTVLGAVLGAREMFVCASLI